MTTTTERLDTLEPRVDELEEDLASTCSAVAGLVRNPQGSAQAAIAAIVRELPGIGKDDQAPANMGGFRYRGIEAMTRAIQPLLGQHGLVIVPQARELEVVPSLNSNNKQMQDVRIRFDWLIIGPDGGSFTASTYGIGRDHTDKGGNKAQTQAYKYLLMHLFCISDPREDADGHDYTRGEGDYTEAAADDPSPMAPVDPIKVIWARITSWAGDKSKANQLKGIAETHEVRLTEKSLAEHEGFRTDIVARLDAFDAADDQDAAAEGPTVDVDPAPEPQSEPEADEGTTPPEEPETATEPPGHVNTAEHGEAEAAVADVPYCSARDPEGKLGVCMYEEGHPGEHVYEEPF